jgi:hypothetical protein
MINYRSVDEATLKHYWRVLNVILKKSPISIFSPIYFQVNHGKKGKYNSPSKNKQRFLVRPRTVHFIQTNLIIFRDLVPLTTERVKEGAVISKRRQQNDPVGLFQSKLLHEATPPLLQ